MHTYRTEATYAAFCSCFVVVLVLTNIIGVKLFLLPADGWFWWIPGEGQVTLTSGIITYPLTFLLTDVVAEMWGRRRASYMVILGFVMSIFMLLVVNMTKHLPWSNLWANPDLGLDSEQLQQAFVATFFYPSLLLFASMLAYLVAQLFDVRLYHFWWRVTGGGHMWLRNNGSTCVSQLLDTIIVNGIFLRWGLEMEWSTVWDIILTVYVCKVALALCDTPLIYVARWWLRRFFGLPGGRAGVHAPLAPPGSI